MNRSTKTRLLLRDKYKVVHSDRLYRPVSTVSTKSLYYRTTHMTRSVRMRVPTLVSPEQHVSTSTVTGSTNPY